MLHHFQAIALYDLIYIFFYGLYNFVRLLLRIIVYPFS